MSWFGNSGTIDKVNRIEKVPLMKYWHWKYNAAEHIAKCYVRVGQHGPNIYNTSEMITANTSYSQTCCLLQQHMMTSSNGNIFGVTGHLWGEFTGPGVFPAQRPVTRNFDVFFELRPNKLLSKQPWGCWFETPSRSLWRQCKEKTVYHIRCEVFR